MQIVGATEEVEDEEEHEGVATVLTALGHHFMQGDMVKVEHDIDYDDDGIIYRYVYDLHLL